MVGTFEKSRSIVVRCNGGQFTFSRLRQAATDAQLFELATCLNAFQVNNLDKVFKVRVLQF
jgi:hypothetical protein